MTTTRHGAFLFNVHDTIIGRSLEAYGEVGEPDATPADETTD